MTRLSIEVNVRRVDTSPQLPIQLRKADVVRYFDGNMATVGRAFVATTHRKALSRIAVFNWPDLLPELRARQLLEAYPDLGRFVLDPITGAPKRKGSGQG